MVSEFGEARMELEYKVWSKGNINKPTERDSRIHWWYCKMQSKDKAGWEHCMVMLIKANVPHLCGPWNTVRATAAGPIFFASYPLLLGDSVSLDSGVTSVLRKHANPASMSFPENGWSQDRRWWMNKRNNRVSISDQEEVIKVQNSLLCCSAVSENGLVGSSRGKSCLEWSPGLP